ncbi:hypothetical protein H0H81_002803 [Sphagnurus paluster]|uniref:Uncharacterized protein n=1 Tax=Sphagnurus paluster TaxID=117069 RepID=A0A9P7FRU2_9AGAR|nr:hypothetical protein H0H81_002803 [Sphagnurus paluster]
MKWPSIRHEQTETHLKNVREIAKAAEVPSSPFQQSSPPQSDGLLPVPEPLTNVTMPGPALPGDADDSIYDDWDDIWLPAESPPPPDDEDFQNVVDGWENDDTPFGLHFGETFKSGTKSDTPETPSDDISEAAELPTSSDSSSDLSDNSDLLEFGCGNEPEDLSTGPPPPHDEDWYPWPNQSEALLDIMAAFPRSVFSESELEATRWFASKVGGVNLPTIREVKLHRKNVLATCGADPEQKNGSLGNLFSILDFNKILAHEWANPLVRPHIKILSEDAGEHLSEPSQAEKWKTEVSSDLSGPIVRHEDKDYFVNEPALASLDNSQEFVAVLPTRWFVHDGKVWAKARRLHQDPDNSDHLLIDG